MKFDSLMQNDISNTVIWSKSKPEVEFKHDGRLFFQTGNVNTVPDVPKMTNNDPSVPKTT